MFTQISKTKQYARWAKRSKQINAKMLVKITKQTSKPFKGEEGVMIPYFWYKAERQDDGVTFQFGSRNAGHVIGEFKEITLEKKENGKWVEPTA